jgi:hypothetical protein
MQNAFLSFFVYPSICGHVTTREQLNGFSRNLIFEGFAKISRHIQVLLKSDNLGHVTRRPFIFAAVLSVTRQMLIEVTYFELELSRK